MRPLTQQPRGKITALVGLLATWAPVACGSPLDSTEPSKHTPATKPAADGSVDADTEETPSEPPDDLSPTPQPWSVLTYNVAGLPQVLSSSDPSRNTARMSPLLNAYDLVLVQEDFRYHAELAAQAEHPFQSVPTDQPSLGDGLNTFSRSPLSDFERQPWTACHGAMSSGSDCLTPKGFTVATHALAPGVLVDVYDVHMDAGRGSGDAAARADQGAQLAAMIAMRSAGRAVLVMGDTNWKEDDEADLLEFLSEAGLQDVCRLLQCPEPELHDRLMFRSSATVLLTPTAWRIDPRFVDEDGEPLSDHRAVAADFVWSAP